jgi:hypothetical protein
LLRFVISVGAIRVVGEVGGIFEDFVQGNLSAGTKDTLR